MVYWFAYKSGQVDDLLHVILIGEHRLLIFLQIKINKLLSG